MSSPLTGVSSRAPIGVASRSGLARWLDAIPHPPVACEIGPRHVAAARYTRTAPGLEDYAVESLPEGAIAVSPVELNIVDAAGVRSAVERVLRRIHVRGQQGTLLVPDQVVRVFLLNFETFPKSSEEALPLLRWRLKKSVPFDVEDTVVSFTRQASPGEGVGVLAAVARARIIRQYEEMVEAAGLEPGVVLSSTLGVLPLLEADRPALLARLTGTTLTTVLTRGDVLCVYRCSESEPAATLTPQALLAEMYPAVAFYQDTWKESVAQVRLAGLGSRYEEFRQAVQAELGVNVAPLAPPVGMAERSPGDARGLMDRNVESLVGWMMNRWV